MNHVNKPPYTNSGVAESSDDAILDLPRHLVAGITSDKYFENHKTSKTRKRKTISSVSEFSEEFEDQKQRSRIVSSNFHVASTRRHHLTAISASSLILYPP